MATGSTTFQEPFNALDVVSQGRAGWNAVTTSDQAVAANFGRPVAKRAERYERAHETIQIEPEKSYWRNTQRSPGRWPGLPVV